MHRIFNPARPPLAAACGLSFCLLALALALTPPPSLAADPASPAPGRPLQGEGATLPYPLYAAWAEAYRHETGVDVRYNATDSIAGTRAVEQAKVDFGASEVPLPASELQRRGLMQFPAVIGAVVPVVNLAGVAPGGLTLSGEVLGDIFLGRIRRWDDPAIAALNPGLALPGVNITVVHRADASGTTFVWSRYLAHTNAEWRRRFGAASVIDWPTGVGEPDSDGIASSVQRIKASIGYLEFAYAQLHHLSCVGLRAGLSGPTVAPDPDSLRLGAASASVDGSVALAGDDGPEVGKRPTPGANSGLAWPVSAPSYILVRVGRDAQPTTEQVLAFFAWAWRRQASVATDLGYTPLPVETARANERRWRAVQAAPPPR